MPSRVSLKVVCVLAAIVFVAAFRVHAGGGSTPPARAGAATLSAAGAKALRADVARPTSTPVNARLASVAGLPGLRRAPTPEPTPQPVPQVAVAPVPTAATPVPTPVATVAPVVTAAPRPVATAAPAPKYIGQSFDSQG